MIGMPGKSYRGELPPADEVLLSLAGELRQDVTRLAVDIGERNVRTVRRSWHRRRTTSKPSSRRRATRWNARSIEVSGCQVLQPGN